MTVITTLSTGRRALTKLVIGAAALIILAGCQMTIEPGPADEESNMAPTGAVTELTPATAVATATITMTDALGTPTIPAQATNAAPTTPQEEPTTMSATTPQSTRDALIARAQQDLAERLAIAPDAAADEVVVVSAVAQDWPDGSLGCPEAGMMYPQVITPGYRIVLEAGGDRYDYRAPMRRDGPVRLCVPQKLAPPTRSR